MNEAQIRATFKDTKNAQEKLRFKLDTLEEENIHVEDKGEFFNLLADALLGMEYNKECKLILSDGSTLKIINLGKFIRDLAYINDNVLDGSFFQKYNIVIKTQIPINVLWNVIKFELFGVFPEALAVSVRISKEQTQDRRKIRTIPTVPRDVRYPK